ncbi:MAG: HEAT repeat domain-containing protein [Proteobacteria bacterium]|nr:HEAT repeat domain-containing protein [Pseudomonadota bacterium]
MDIKKIESSYQSAYVAVRWQFVPDSIHVKPHEHFICCDLRNCSFDGLDLSEVDFFGCRLDGASFAGTTLQGAKFIGCFSADKNQPVDFRNCLLNNVSVIDSHLSVISDRKLSGLWNWPSEVVKWAAKTSSERNDVRYEAVKELGGLGDPVVASMLVYLLTDEEWDVRLVALEALGRLRENKVFPHRDRLLLKLMFLLLGDEHSLVRQEAGGLVRTLSPPDDILKVSIQRVMEFSPNEILAGLRAAAELCKVSSEYTHLVDTERLQFLLSDDNPEVRGKCLQLLGILDDPSNMPWILRGLSDSRASVRVAALCTIKLLTERPPASEVIPLLADPDEEVRIEAIYTIGQIGEFNPQELEIAMSDPSSKVRQLVEELLKPDQ